MCTTYEACALKSCPVQTGAVLWLLCYMMILFMYKYKKGLLPVHVKINSYNIQIDQTYEIFLFHPEKVSQTIIYNNSFLNQCLKIMETSTT